MRILQVISTPPDAWRTGGTASVAIGLSAALARDGHEVTIATMELPDSPGSSSSSGQHEFLDGVSVLRFPPLADWAARKYKFYLAPGLIAYLAGHCRSFDVVHVQDLLSVHAFAASASCESGGVPYVLTPHGSLPRLRELATRFGSPGLRLGTTMLRRAAMITTLNRVEASECLALGCDERRVAIVPNGVDPVAYVNPPSPEAFRRLVGIEEDERVVLYLGRLNKTKNLRLLVESFADVAKHHPQVKLALVGPDEGEGLAMTKLAATLGIGRSVLVPGYVESAMRLSALAASEILVVPRFTGFPITILESYAIGTPVITTEESDTLEWLDSTVGQVVPPTIQGLAVSIGNFLEDPSIKVLRGSRGRALVMERFTWEVVAGQYEAVYSRCTRDGGNEAY